MELLFANTWFLKTKDLLCTLTMLQQHLDEMILTQLCFSFLQFDILQADQHFRVGKLVLVVLALAKECH
jgi:hypothetical protein